MNRFKHQLFLGNSDLESSLEVATDNVIPINMTFTTLNLDKPTSYESIKTDLSAMVTNTTLNIAADEFIPAKDVHDIQNLSKIPSSTRPFSRAGVKQDESVASVMQAFEDQLMTGQNSNEHIQDDKIQFQSKIPRLVNDFYFPGEISIREYREMNDQHNGTTSQTYLRRLSKLNVNDSRFPGEDNHMSIRELREISDQKKAEMSFENLVEKRKMEDRVPEGKIVTIGGVEKLTFNRPENDVEETYTAGGSSNLTMPLIASALSMEAFLIERLRKPEDGSIYPSLNLNPTSVQEPTVVYENLARRSSFSLKPQTSLAALTADSQEAIVDDDGFERNFVSAFNLNIVSISLTLHF